ncbi:alginate biosynthesis TPR repeat lipoprotein AlgK [Metapseudomonas lalkuanensis]|uniref:alginate biosynthesis TPR repeat lipoprotein AlgK n=1 Tax=Metapseudomonas lalkuanensis TaxID=2604832 RepID=UPI001CF0FD37|nr:alginate biosynthesis TPR repeat lipoprotein AlgK [Pseudomonas lalkuanensis]UCO99304.1 alginate biosynthesis TPR repeat lipoprotein AlgK [Pseudomonas lalkuanensis]
MAHHATPVLLLAAAVALAGCAGLPDERLAREALKSGDNATAEQNFRQLADLGYADAAVGLADLQVASGDPEQLAKAEQTYRQAMDQSPRAKARLGKLLARKAELSPAERRETAQLLEESFAAGEESSLLPLVMLYLQYPQDFPEVNVPARIAKWRAEGHTQAELAQILFYRTQGTYDQHLGEIEQICTRNLAQADVCYVELATVYQKQGNADAQQKLLEQMMAGYRAGRIPAQRVDSVANVLADADLGKPDDGKAKELLEAVAPTYPAAWVSLAKLLYDYPGQGDTEQLLGYLEKGRAASLPQAELLLGRLYYEGKLVPLDPKKAEEHLLNAAPTEPRANYLLGQIYLRGYLGEIDPQKALERLLSAARNGQINADFALGQMYVQGKGVQRNLVNAYVFSQLALPKNTPQAQELAQQVAQQLPPADRARAEQLLREERAARGAAVPDTQMSSL